MKSGRGQIGATAVGSFIGALIWRFVATAAGWRDYGLVESLAFAAFFAGVMALIQAYRVRRKRQASTSPSNS